MQPPSNTPNIDEHVTPDEETDAVVPSGAPTPAPATSTGKALARVTAGITLMHLLRVIVGFATQPLIANRLGLKAAADAYAVSTDIVSSFWLVFEKIVNPSVLPIFAHTMKDEGEEKAWRFASAAFCITMLGVIIITPLAYWGMPLVVDLYSQSAGTDERELTVALARLLLSGLWSLAFSSLTYVILNGYKRFASAALGDTFWRVGIMIAALYAVKMKLDPIPALYVLAYGFILGSLLKLVPQLIALRSKLGLFRPNLNWNDPLVRRMFWLAVPLFIGIVTSEGRDIFRNWIADSPEIANVEGARAALKFARTIGSNLVNIFPYALSIGIFPYLADMARDKDQQPFTDTLIGALRVCFFVFGPLTAILIALHLPMLRAVWESGKFTQADTLVLAAPFIAFNLGLIGFACENILNQSFYAKTQPWMPTAIGLFTTGVFIATSFAGVKWLGWGLASIAGAEAIQKSLKCLIMWSLLRPQLGDVKLKENLVFFAKMAIGSLVAAAASFVIYKVIGPAYMVEEFNKKRGLLAVAASGLGGVMVFVAFSLMLKVKEAEMLVKRSSSLLKKAESRPREQEGRRSR